ncbi:hypothetical protein ES705_43398 [subsurface metagenome]
MKIFHISYKFKEDSDDLDNFRDILSKISLSKFEKVKYDFSLERISIIEQLFPEVTKTPFVIFNFKELELYLSTKKINISYPKDLTGRRRVIPKRGKGFWAPPFIKEKEKRTLDFNDLKELDDFIKIFLLSEVMGNINLDLEEMFIAFQLDLGKELNLERISQDFKPEIFKDNRFILERFDFEITEEGNIYYFEVIQNRSEIMCSFMYNIEKYSIFKETLEVLVRESYEKCNKILEEII